MVRERFDLGQLRHVRRPSSWPESTPLVSRANHIGPFGGYNPDLLKQLQRLPRVEFETALRTIIALSHNPRPAGAKKLVGGSSDWRVRCGQYRIVYSIDDDAAEVMIFVVAKRSDAYR